MTLPTFTTDWFSDFTGSDEGTISEGGVWTGFSGLTAMQRLTNRLNGAGAGYSGSYLNVRDWSDLEAIIQLGTAVAAGSEWFFHFRLADSGNQSPIRDSNKIGYVFHYVADTAAWTIERQDPAGTTLASGTQSLSANERIMVRAVGSGISAWRSVGNGDFTQLGSATDTTYKTGKVGFLTSGGASNAFDNLRIGEPSVNPNLLNYPVPSLRRGRTYW